MSMATIPGKEYFRGQLVHITGFCIIAEHYLNKTNGGEINSNFKEEIEALNLTDIANGFDEAILNLDTWIQRYNTIYVDRRNADGENFSKIELANFEEVNTLGNKFKSGEYTREDIMHLRELTKPWRDHIMETVIPENNFHTEI